MMITAHQGPSADPRLIQTVNEKEMTHTFFFFANKCQKVTPDSQTQPSVFVFSFRLFRVCSTECRKVCSIVCSIVCRKVCRIVCSIVCGKVCSIVCRTVCSIACSIV